LYEYCSDLGREACEFPSNQETGQTRVERLSYYGGNMSFPIKVCVICSQEFELKPDKPGFANRCPECSAPESSETEAKGQMDADERRSKSDMNAARRKAIRDLLYRKDS
jgi:hypothetical protein